jgi:hypothetical protein
MHKNKNNERTTKHPPRNSKGHLYKGPNEDTHQNNKAPISIQKKTWSLANLPGRKEYHPTKIHMRTKMGHTEESISIWDTIPEDWGWSDGWDPQPEDYHTEYINHDREEAIHIPGLVCTHIHGA